MGRIDGMWSLAPKRRLKGFPNPREPFVAFEDSSLVAVVKPAGLDTAPLGSLEEESLLKWTLEKYPEIRKLPGRKPCEPGLLHRLDRETSGIVLFARGKAAYETLAKFQEEGLIKKEYLALCEFSPEGIPWAKPYFCCPQGTEPCEWIGLIYARSAMLPAPCFVESRFKAYGPGRRRVVPVGLERKGSERIVRKSPSYRTDILFAEAFGKALVRMRISLESGFRHQIRAHLAWIGLPILGDPLYGRPREKKTGYSLGDIGMHLHALSMDFPHPETGTPLRIASPFPHVEGEEARSALY